MVHSVRYTLSTLLHLYLSLSLSLPHTPCVVSYMLIQLMPPRVNGKLLRTARVHFKRGLIVVFALSHASPGA